MSLKQGRTTKELLEGQKFLFVRFKGQKWYVFTLSKDVSVKWTRWQSKNLRCAGQIKIKGRMLCMPGLKGYSSISSNLSFSHTRELRCVTGRHSCFRAACLSRTHSLIIQNCNCDLNLTIIHVFKLKKDCLKHTLFQQTTIQMAT